MNRHSGVFVILPLAVLLGVAGSAGAQASPLEASPLQDSSVQESSVQDSPAQMAAVAMVETILAGEDGEPAWDALASALGDRSVAVRLADPRPGGVGSATLLAGLGGPELTRSEAEGAELTPAARIAGRVRSLASTIRALPSTAETLAIAGVLALLAIAAIAVALGSIRRRRALADSGGGRTRPGRVRRFRLSSGRSRRAGGRSRPGPVCRDAARLEAHLRTRRSA